MTEMRRPISILIVLATLALAGCSHTPKEQREEAQQKEFFECKNGIETPHCTEQKNTEAQEKETEQVKEALREYQRLHGE